MISLRVLGREILGFEPLPKNYDARTILVVWPEGNWQLRLAALAVWKIIMEVNNLPDQKDVWLLFATTDKPRAWKAQRVTWRALAGSAQRSKTKTLTVDSLENVVYHFDYCQQIINTLKKTC